MPAVKSKAADSIDGMDLSVLAEQELEEVYRGAPESFSDAGPESPVIEHTPIDGPVELEDDRVMLVNIYFTEEVVMIPNGKKWSGKVAEFVNGRLVTDRDTADRVLACCPYVYEEPKVGEWLTHNESGFTTRNPVRFAEFSQRWADNR